MKRLSTSPAQQQSPSFPVAILSSAERPALGLLATILPALGVQYALTNARNCLNRVERGPLGGVIILGGTETATDPLSPTMLEMLRLTDRLASMEVPILGICLGAQLLARVLGGNVIRHPTGVREIGYHQTFQANPTVKGLFPAGLYYHWHYDVVTEIPCGMTHLSSRHTQAQSFAHGHLFGVQFHPEITAATIRKWTTLGKHRLRSKGAQSRRKQLLIHRKVVTANRRSLKLALATLFCGYPTAGR